MNSEQVWQVWRRVLREPELAAAVIDGSVLTRSAEWNLSEPEREIVRHYTLSPRGVSWAVDGYRFRLVRVTRYCVAQAAPLTARALTEAGRDPARLVQEFVEHTGWLDRGPYVLELTLSYLRYLQEVEFSRQACEPPAVTDIVKLEIAGLLLALEQAGSARQRPEPARWTGRACVVAVSHDVMPWLAEPAGNPLSAAARQQREVLVYLDDSVNNCRLVALSDAAATVARLLADGASPAKVAETLGVEPAHPGLAAMLETFVGWGIVTPTGNGKASEPASHEG